MHYYSILFQNFLFICWSLYSSEKLHFQLALVQIIRIYLMEQFSMRLPTLSPTLYAYQDKLLSCYNSLVHYCYQNNQPHHSMVMGCRRLVVWSFDHHYHK